MITKQKKQGKRERAKVRARLSCALAVNDAVNGRALVLPVDVAERRATQAQARLDVLTARLIQARDPETRLILRRAVDAQGALVAQEIRLLAVARNPLTIEPIVYARPLSETRETTSVHALSMRVNGANGCDRSVPRKGGNPKRFHDPVGGLVKARVIGLKPKQTKARFSAPAKAPVTAAQYAELARLDARRALTWRMEQAAKATELALLAAKEAEEKAQLRGYETAR